MLVLVTAACSPTPPQSSRPSVDSASTPPPAMVEAPQASRFATPKGETVRGWPSTVRNLAGTYSWDGSRCSTAYCIVGFMHNGYGSGDVAITIDVPVRAIPDDGATAATVAGHEGSYRQIDDGKERWLVDIEGTTVVILLEARPGTSRSDLADAHGIIESLRAEPQDSALGFRLVFTLTTDEWDSG